MVYTVLAKVTFWDEVEEKIDKAVHILTAYSFADAAKQLEDYYGENLNKMHLTMYDEAPATFPVNMYEELKDILGGKLLS